MDAHEHYKEYEPMIRRMISYHANRLSPLPCFNYMTKEDLKQELFCEIWKSLDVYNPEKSKLTTFLDRVLSRRAKTLIARHQCDKRGGKGNNTISLEDMDREKMQPETLFLDPLFTEAGIMAQVEVRKAMDKLTEPQLELCKEIQGATIIEIAERKGCSRASLYRVLDEMKATLGPIEVYLPMTNKTGKELH